MNSVEDFINNYPNPKIIQDCHKLIQIFTKQSGREPVLWGKMIGFGKYHYVQKASEGDWFAAGFAPTKVGITLYITSGFAEFGDLLEKLGKHKKSVGCLYIKNLQEIDLVILKEIISKSIKYMKDKYGDI